MAHRQKGMNGALRETFTAKGQEWEERLQEMVQPSKPLNLVDIFKQVFIFHFLKTIKNIGVCQDNFTTSSGDNGSNSWNTEPTAAIRRLKSARHYYTQSIAESDNTSFPSLCRGRPMKSSWHLEFCLFNTVEWTIRCPRLWAGSVAAFKTDSQSAGLMNSVFYKWSSLDFHIFTENNMCL